MIKFPNSYTAVAAELEERLREHPPTLVQILCGPRQVGKTTLLLEIARKRKQRAIYAAADTTEAALPGWWEEQWRKVEAVADPEGGLILFDEIHYLPDWNRMLILAGGRWF
jgi:hypothetical protein